MACATPCIFQGGGCAVLPWQKTRVFRQATASPTYSQARGVHAMMPSDTTSLPEPLLPFRRRPPTLVLPTDPSEEELLQFWTLSSQDKEEVHKCRGEAQRRRFAVQLCTLRTYGRFLPKAVAAPVAITNHLAQQLDLPLVLFVDATGRLATETDHFQRIRTYLGW